MEHSRVVLNIGRKVLKLFDWSRCCWTSSCFVRGKLNSTEFDIILKVGVWGPSMLFCEGPSQCSWIWHWLWHHKTQVHCSPIPTLLIHSGASGKNRSIERVDLKINAIKKSHISMEILGFKRSGSQRRSVSWPSLAWWDIFQRVPGRHNTISPGLPTLIICLS
jgi:hypothetical protein